MITRIATPLGIFIIMLGMGLSLTPADFKRVWVQPKAICIGIILQILGLPILGFTFVTLLKLEPVLSAAIMLLSACPGGAITNLVSFISKGDAALSVSLTSINSFITVLTIPLITTFSLEYFLGKAVAQNVNITTLSLGIVFITIPPIIIGMVIRNRLPDLADRSESWVQKGTIAFILLLAGFACYSDKEVFLENYQDLALVALALALSSLFLGAVVGAITGLPRKQVLTLSIEVGLHNSAMAIVIALSFLGMFSLALFSAFYLIFEYMISGLLMATMNSPFGSKLLELDPLPITEN